MAGREIRDKGRSQIVFGESDEYSVTHFPLEQKTLSTGMVTSLKDVSTFRRMNKYKVNETESKERYRAQLEADQFSVMPSSRKAYERKISFSASGMVIQDQLGDRSPRSVQRSKAAEYMRQLDADLAAKVRLPSSTRPPLLSESKYPHHPSAKLDESSLFEPSTSLAETLTFAKSKRFENSFATEELKLSTLKPKENLDTFFIGADETVLKQRNRVLNKDYTRKLDADTSLDRQPTHSMATPETVTFAVYKNTLGWTGADIGGSASNPVNLREERLLKQSQQQEYAQLLKEQVKEAEARRMSERIFHRQEPKQEDSMPYMQSSISKSVSRN